MNTIVRICAGRPVAAVMVVCAVLLAGAKGTVTMPLGRLPDIAVPRVVVEASVPGLPAATIRALVASPLEDALASVKGLVRSSSISRDGRAVLVLDFRWGENSARAAAQVREIIDSAYQSLPEGAEKPNVLAFDPGLEPLVIATLTPRNGDMVFARRLAEYEARARLRRVDGAGAVVVIGGVEMEVTVAVDMGKAAVRGLTVVDIARVIATENVDVPVGILREGDIELVAVAHGRAPDVPALAATLGTGPSGSFKLGDVAIIQESNAQRKSLFVAGGVESVAIEMYKRPGADPVATARKAREAIAGMAKEFDREAEILLVFDASLPIEKAILDLAAVGVLGAALAVPVLFLFLRQLKAGILVALSIPVSAAAAFAVLSALGRSLNNMSLGGIGLAVGMISDNAVVIMEALSSSCSGHSTRPGLDEIADAVGSAITGTFGSMVTTAVVFIPVLFLPGALGGLFGDLAVSIIAANVSGWLTAVLALPALYRILWTPGQARKGMTLEPLYRRSLAFGFRRPVVVIGVAAFAAAGGCALVATREVSFMPLDAATELLVVAEFPAGSNPDGMMPVAAALSCALSKVPGTSGVYGSAGAEDDDSSRRVDPAYTREILTLHCPLAAKADVVHVRIGLLEVARSVLPAGVKVLVRMPSDAAAVLLGLDVGNVIGAKGDTIESACDEAGKVASAIQREAGDNLASILKTPSGNKPRVVMRPNREAQASRGITLADTARAVRTATEGVEVSTLDADGRETAIRVFAIGARMAGGDGSISGVSAVPVSVLSGVPVMASSVARFEHTNDVSALTRLDRSDVVYLEARAVPGREQELSAAIGRVVARMDKAVRVDESSSTLYGSSMAGAVVLVIVLLYLTLGAQFESFTLPVVIMAAIPLAMAGAGPALVLAGIGLDSGSVLGFVVLFGVVVNNAILLYETSSARRASGASPAVAAYAGASERVRAVLATTMTTVMALLPMCITPSGAAQRSMSVAMLGGLVASTTLTLFVLPIVFSWLGRGLVKGHCMIISVGDMA